MKRILPYILAAGMLIPGCTEGDGNSDIREEREFYRGRVTGIALAGENPHIGFTLQTEQGEFASFSDDFDDAVMIKSKISLGDLVEVYVGNSYHRNYEDHIFEDVQAKSVRVLERSESK